MQCFIHIIYLQINYRTQSVMILKNDARREYFTWLNKYSVHSTHLWAILQIFQHIYMHISNQKHSPFFLAEQPNWLLLHSTSRVQIKRFVMFRCYHNFVVKRNFIWSLNEIVLINICEIERALFGLMYGSKNINVEWLICRKDIAYSIEV